MALVALAARALRPGALKKYMERGRDSASFSGVGKSANPAVCRMPRCYLYPSRMSVDVGHGLSLGLGRALLAATRLLASCLLWRVLGRVGSTR